MKIVYEPHQDGKRSRVSIWYDTDDVERGEPIAVSTVPARSGLVGFSWVMTKFKIRMLKITGKLDKPAAVKFLRKKLGKTTGGGAGGKGPQKGAGAEGGSPTLQAGGSGAPHVGPKPT